MLCDRSAFSLCRTPFIKDEERARDLEEEEEEEEKARGQSSYCPEYEKNAWNLSVVAGCWPLDAVETSGAVAAALVFRTDNIERGHSADRHTKAAVVFVVALAAKASASAQRRQSSRLNTDCREQCFPPRQTLFGIDLPR